MTAFQKKEQLNINKAKFNLFAFFINAKRRKELETKMIQLPPAIEKMFRSNFKIISKRDFKGIIFATNRYLIRSF